MAVRRKAPDFWRKFGAVKLYQEDVLAVDTIVRQVAEDARITADGYEVDSVEELAQVSGGEPLRKVEWFSSRPSGGAAWLSVSLGPSLVSVNAPQCDVELRGPCEAISDLLDSRRRWPAELVRKTYVVSLVFLVATLVGGQVASPSGWAGVVLAAGALVAAAWCNAAAWVHFWRRAIVVPAPRSERPSFWRRKGDSVRVALITAPLTAILTYVATKGAER